MAISSSSSSSSSDNEKVVKERDELKLKIEKWEESSKNLDELLNSQMSARDKTGLGYGTQLNEMSNNSKTDSEISLSVFYVRSSDEESTPVNDMISKADGYHVVPPPITWNFLTPRADISFAGLDEYAIRKKIIESKTTDLNTKTSETVDDEDDVFEVQTVSPVKTNESQTVKPRVDKIGQTFQKQGILFINARSLIVYQVDLSAKIVIRKLKKEWKPTGRIYTIFGHKWLPTGRTFTMVGNQYPLTKINPARVVPSGKPNETKIVHIVLWYLDSGLVPNPASSTPIKPPSKKELDILFQPTSDEYFKPTPSSVSSTISTANLSEDTADATSSTTIDQDVP
ncbi:hypothetical protein Tco_0212884 [Tanacetum coccineum]